MTRLLSYQASVQEKGLRLDAFMASKGLYPSRSQTERMIEEGKVFVNGKTVPKKYKLETGDTIVYELEQAISHEFEPKGQAIPLDIRYEDDDLMVISKQKDLVCHPSPDHFDNTLVNALIYHCGYEHLCNVQGNNDRLGIVHRLDRDTTGLMLVAKTNTAGTILMDQIRDRVVDRHYLCLVQGRIAPDSGMIDAPIARNKTDRLRMAVADLPSARDALTSFKVLERFEAQSKDLGYTLLDCKLFTGRTHQIRVHMNYIHHACVGDPVYGTGSLPAQLGLTRQFLHSYCLCFDHPITGENLSFYDPLPEDLQACLDNLKPRSLGKTTYGEELALELEGLS